MKKSIRHFFSYLQIIYMYLNVRNDTNDALFDLISGVCVCVRIVFASARKIIFHLIGRYSISFVFVCDRISFVQSCISTKWFIHLAFCLFAFCRRAHNLINDIFI